MNPCFFGGSDDEFGDDPPITEKDRLKREKIKVKKPKK